MCTVILTKGKLIYFEIQRYIMYYLLPKEVSSSKSVIDSLDDKGEIIIVNIE